MDAGQLKRINEAGQFMASSNEVNLLILITVGRIPRWAFIHSVE